ncbi:MAG: hypothetical protein PHH52_02615 [Patescibacteria group bacterium]|jgi:hypothetical protein|nr:hypothetical protein [Patescibacteria group bacterium]MDD3778252.1 hypothetical protein [Patescibacteria group bacterium]MDD3939290.1 hypothetical protein [Patescibacteria group bacterium]MDD4443928.1 hypothetical protein [Patescibacteria group bacterium]NCU39541.1 hypothetical protein [Candidatus Falkowbacteria bacterium]
MKIFVYKSQLQENPEMFLRKAGYSFIPEREDGERSFARRLSRDFYPRFHVYYKEGYDKEGKEMILFNLHLDQKRPGYIGQKRHNAEYDGKTVEEEAERIKSLVLPDFFQ